MKKGIALLITLFFITLLGALILENQKITEETFQNTEQNRFLIQSNVALKDTLKLLKNMSAFITDQTTFDYFLQIGELQLSDPDSEIELTLQYEKANHTININKLSTDWENPNQFYELLDELLIQEAITDPPFFIAILQDTLDADTNERIYGSEIADDKPFLQQRIASWEQFQEILDHYQKERNDPRIQSIDWRVYINFEHDSLDFNYADPKLLDMMLPNTYIDSRIHEKTYANYDELDFLTADDANRSQSFGVGFYVPVIACNLIFTQFGYNSRIKFFYDLKEKKAYGFEYEI